MNTKLRSKSAYCGAYLIICLLICFFNTAVLAQEALVPYLKARVTDLTHTLSPQQKQSLEEQLAALEQDKGSQVLVLIVPSVKPDTVETYARKVFDQWKIGRAKADDGVLFLIAKNDRRMRIEVGYGLEGAIPDALAGRIINEGVAPFFKNNRYFDGIDFGIKRIIDCINNEDLPLKAVNTANKGANQDMSETESTYFLIFFAFFVSLWPVFLAAIVGAIGGYFYTGSILFALGGAIAAILIRLVVCRLVPTLRVNASKGSGGFKGSATGGFISTRDDTFGNNNSSNSSSGNGFGGGRGGSSGGGGASGGW